jgi:hypothetical protein
MAARAGTPGLAHRLSAAPFLSLCIGAGSQGWSLCPEGWGHNALPCKDWNGPVLPLEAGEVTR